LIIVVRTSPPAVICIEAQLSTDYSPSGSFSSLALRAQLFFLPRQRSIDRTHARLSKIDRF
jgi:hypothetical protein